MIDESQRLPSHQGSDLSCIILAGGKGTRLFPLTQTRCKPAVGFGGRYRLIDIPLSNAINSHIEQIFVISQYFSAFLQDYIKRSYACDHLKGGQLSFLSPEERHEGTVYYRGTADAVRQNLPYVVEASTDYVLILSGDQLYNMDLGKMVNFARECDADLTIGAFPIEEYEAKRFGIIQANREGWIQHFHEKPTTPQQLTLFRSSPLLQKHLDKQSHHTFLASMGIYLFKKKVLVQLLQEDRREDFGKHLIPTQITKGGASAFLYQGYWKDIGTINSFYQSNLDLICEQSTDQRSLKLNDAQLPIYSHPDYFSGARIYNSHVDHSILCNGTTSYAESISNSIVGLRSVIGSGSVIESSIIMGNGLYRESPQWKGSVPHDSIGQNCQIKKTILDENVRLGHDVQLINKRQLDHYDGEGIFVRDGIIVVTSNTNLPNGFLF